MTASTREWRWSFSRMLRTWFLTVFSEMVSSPAISRLLMPVAMRRSTCSSRSVSRGGAVVRVSACLASELNSVRSFAAIDGVMRLLPAITDATASPTSSIDISLSR